LWKKIYIHSPDCAWREIGGEVFIVSSKSGGVHMLNPVASFIWTHLDGNSTVAAIASELEKEFDVENSTINKDIPEFFDEMTKIGIVSEKQL